MKDISGNKLNVGDKVWVTVPYYKNLTPAIILKDTPKGATVEFGSFDKKKTTSRTSEQIVLNQQKRIEELEVELKTYESMLIKLEDEKHGSNLW